MCALQFDPSSYGQAYNQGQENELRNKYRGLESLAGLSQQLGQIGQNMTSMGQARAQQEQQKKLYELQLADAQRKQAEADKENMTVMEMLSGDAISRPITSFDMEQKPLENVYTPPTPMPSFGPSQLQGRPNLIEQFRNRQIGGKLRLGQMDVGQEMTPEGPLERPTQGQPYQAFGPQPKPDISAQMASLGLPSGSEYMTLGQLKPLGEFRKLFASAGESDYYTPDQVKAIYPSGGEALSQAFGEKIPKAAVSTASMAGSREANLGFRKGQEEERLDEKGKARFRNYLLDMEQRDPVIKEMNKQGLALGQVDQILNMAKNGNTVSAGALGFKMGRAMGEVGVMTDQDVVRYVQSGALGRGAADKLSRWIRGVPTDATLEEIQQISTALQDTFQSKIQPKYDNYINSYSRVEGLTPQVFADKLALPYGGSSRINKPTGQQSTGGGGGADPLGIR